MLHNRLRPGNPEKPNSRKPPFLWLPAIPNPQGKTSDPAIPTETREWRGAAVQDGRAEGREESGLGSDCQFVRVDERGQGGGGGGG